MLDNYEHIAYLINGFNNGKLTQPERDELDKWLTVNDRNQLLFDELCDPNRLREYLHQMQGYDEGGSWKRIKEGVPSSDIPVRKLFYWEKIAIAASLVLMIGVGTYYAFFNKSSKKNEIVKKDTIQLDVEAPIKTKATISLIDGRTIALDSLVTLKQGDVVVEKNENGEIIYKGSSTQTAYNTLYNPRGSKVVSLTLSDGTKVWLNSESSLKYPTAFSKNTREVMISGEAYFEVAKDPTKKFIVISSGVMTEVLGTHFNVNNYTDEEKMKITLLEGSIKVTKGGSSALLKPGQQAQITDEITTVNGVNIEEVVAWKEGFFKFSRADIKTIMKQLARWYDLDIQFEGTLPQREFGGEMQRDLPLSAMLRLLEKGKLHFWSDGKTLVVLP